jgi:hypothetical protein
VDDEAAGPFIVLESNAGHEHGLRIDPDELECVVKAARKLIAGLSMNTALTAEGAVERKGNQ